MLVSQGKGGRTVYLGPTSEALPYFEGLGIVCPPLVNPPGIALGIAWCHLVSLGVAWCRFVSLGVAWCRWVSLGVAWVCTGLCTGLCSGCALGGVLGVAWVCTGLCTGS
jgi:hypothetical protein